MPTLKDHQNKPLNNEKPYLFSTSVSYEESSENNSKANLYIDVNKKNKIENLHYTLEGFEKWKGYFSVLSQVVQDKTLAEAREISWNDLSSSLEEELVLEETPFFPLPMILLNRAIDKLKGEKYFIDLMSQEEGGILCRCFGISTGRVLDVLRTNPYSKVKDITDETMASAGCTSCLEDLEELIAEFHENEAGGIKVPAEVLESINTAILNWKIENGLEEFYEISIKDMTGNHLKIEIIPENKKDDIKNALEIYLNQTLDFPFYLSF